MSDARTWTLAEIDRRIALARDSESGEWFDEEDLAATLAAKFVLDSAASDAALIVAHSSAALLPLYEWMRGEVEKHGPVPSPYGPGFICGHCGHGVLGPDDMDCAFLRGLASALGYPGEKSVEELIAASSLGTPHAVVMRASVSNERAADVVRRAFHEPAEPELDDREALYRTARKPWTCQCPGGRKPCPHDDCARTIAPGDRYVEVTSEAAAYESGFRYCLPCGIATYAIPPAAPVQSGGAP